MARYELSDGKSSKFWEVAVEGPQLTTTFGRIGTAGQSSIKVLGSAAEAQREHDKLIAEKTKKGYKLASSAAAAPKPKSPHAELEDRIHEDSTDGDAWQAYGEALKAAGDARGEAVILSLAIERDPEGSRAQKAALDKLFAAHEKEWLGDLAKDEGTRKRVTIEWMRGAFLSKVRVASAYGGEGLSTEQQLRALWKLPSGRFLQWLTLGLADCDGENDYGGCLLVLAKGGVRGSLRRLFIGDFERADECEISWTTIGDVGRLLPVLPNLEELEIQGGKIEIAVLKHAKLRRVALFTGGLPRVTVRAVAAAELPACKDLEVWFGAQDYGAEGDIATLAPLFKSKSLPALRRLGLMNAEFENDIAKAMAVAPLLTQLVELNLSLGTMTDVGGKALLQNASRMKHLKVLDVTTNYLSEETSAALKKAIPGADVARQKKPDGAGEDAYYYVAVGE